MSAEDLRRLLAEQREAALQGEDAWSDRAVARRAEISRLLEALPSEESHLGLGEAIRESARLYAERLEAEEAAAAAAETSAHLKTAAAVVSAQLAEYRARTRPLPIEPFTRALTTGRGVAVSHEAGSREDQPALGVANIVLKNAAMRGWSPEIRVRVERRRVVAELVRESGTRGAVPVPRIALLLADDTYSLPQAVAATHELQAEVVLWSAEPGVAEINVDDILTVDDEGRFLIETELWFDEPLESGEYEATVVAADTESIRQESDALGRILAYLREILPSVNPSPVRLRPALAPHWGGADGESSVLYMEIENLPPEAPYTRTLVSRDLPGGMSNIEVRPNPAYPSRLPRSLLLVWDHGAGTTMHQAQLVLSRSRYVASGLPEGSFMPIETLSMYLQPLDD